jgi:DNA-binding protein YbaB
MTTTVQLVLLLLGSVLTFLFGMIAVNLQKISTNMKELSDKLNQITSEFAESKEKVVGITVGCNARHIDINEQLRDHEQRIRTNELSIAKIVK